MTNTVGMLTVLVLYAIAALGCGTLLWQVARDRNDKRKNCARRVFLTILGTLAWPGAVILGLRCLTAPGHKVINLAVFGRTTLHDTP